jgi:hypothetical protein
MRTHYARKRTIGETARLNATQLAKTWPKVLDQIQDGTMVTFIYGKSPVGLFVPVVVLQKLAGHSLPDDEDRRLQTGIRNALDLEQTVHDLRYTSRAQRVQRGLRYPLVPV